MSKTEKDSYDFTTDWTSVIVIFRGRRFCTGSAGFPRLQPLTTWGLLHWSRRSSTTSTRLTLFVSWAKGSPKPSYALSHEEALFRATCDWFVYWFILYSNVTSERNVKRFVSIRWLIEYIRSIPRFSSFENHEWAYTQYQGNASCTHRSGFTM